MAPVWAETSQAIVKEIRGEAKFLKAGTSDWTMLEKDMILKEGDSVKTAGGSEAMLELTGSGKTAEIQVRPESEFTFQTFRHDTGKALDNTLLDVTVGGVLVKAEKLQGESTFEVKTPTSIVGIRGTTFEVHVSKS